jgi:hypothetical protein
LHLGIGIDIGIDCCFGLGIDIGADFACDELLLASLRSAGVPLLGLPPILDSSYSQVDKYAVIAALPTVSSCGYTVSPGCRSTETLRQRSTERQG